MQTLGRIADQAMLCTRCKSLSGTLCGLSDSAGRAEIAAISGQRLVTMGQTIMANGGDAKLVGTVLAGVLKVSRTLPDGRERIVALLYPGDFFGQVFTASANFAIEAATDAEICVADRLAFEGVFARHPELARGMLLATTGALSQAREQSLLLSCQTTLERIATYLLVMLERRERMLAELRVRPLKDVAAFTVSRSDVASYLGTTFETISRHVHYLDGRGTISIVDSNHFEIVDRDELLAIAGVSDEDVRMFFPPRGEVRASRPSREVMPFTGQRAE
jgi:CRP/FNR family transcriptional regulator